MQRHLRTAGMTLAVLGLSCGLAACGQASDSSSAKAQASAPTDSTFPGLTADQVLAKAKQAIASSTAVEADGHSTSGGQTVDFSLTVVNGKGAVGSVTMGGGVMKVRRVGRTTFAQPSKEFLTQLGPIGASVGTVLNGKWLEADPEALAAVAGDVSGGALTDLTSMTDAASVLNQSIPTGSTLKRVAGKTVDGVQTAGIAFTPASTTGSSAQLSGILYVAATGTPYPVEVDRGTTSTLTLSHWNKAVAITAPPKKLQVSIGSLGLSSLGG